MEPINTDAPERIQALGLDVIAQLGYVASGSETDQAARRAVYDSLPRNLTPLEVAALGSGVASHVELTLSAPLASWQSRKAEVNALRFVGDYAYLRGDMPTLESVVSHLKGLRNLRAKWVAFRLSRERYRLF